VTSRKESDGLLEIERCLVRAAVPVPIVMKMNWPGRNVKLSGRLNLTENAKSPRGMTSIILAGNSMVDTISWDLINNCPFFRSRHHERQVRYHNDQEWCRAGLFTGWYPPNLFSEKFPDFLSPCQ
jgi:hypothetical protein